MSRSYSKILEIFKTYYPQRMVNWVVKQRFRELYGYEPKNSSINSDLCRARKEGIIKKDENGFYYIDNVKSEE